MGKMYVILFCLLLLSIVIGGEVWYRYNEYPITIFNWF